MGMEMILCKAELYNEYIGIDTGDLAGTNFNKAIKSFKQVIPYLDKIIEQGKKVLKILKYDELEAWGDGILVWYNVVRTQPSLQLGMNGRYLPFIVNGNYDVFRCIDAVKFWINVSKKEGDKCKDVCMMPIINLAMVLGLY
eukprot:2992422-Ditylum_brightwellii.AAC.1